MPADLQSILQIEVPVIVQIGSRSMTVDEVMSLGPGAIIEMPKHADDPLDVLVNNKAVGQGTAVKVGENFGVRITGLGDVAERIKAMGDESTDVDAMDGGAQEGTEDVAENENSEP